jgi:predicted AAA+ superfamily ATPase
MNNILKQHAQTLHLSGLLDSLQLRLQEAEANRLPYTQFLELLFQDEINVRHQRLINRRYKQAEFRELSSLENFDFSFNPSINRALIYELATGQFVAQRRDVLLVGPPGVGKSHLVQAIGRQVLKVGFRVLYRSIIVREFYSAEDLGFLDRICGIIERLEDVHERTLARSALVRTCMKKQPRGKFTVAAIPRLALHHLFS